VSSSILAPSAFFWPLYVEEFANWPQEASGRVLRSLAFPNIQLNDFGLTPDGTRLVAIFTNNKRATVDNKLKPSMSARPVEEPMGGVSGAATGGAVADVTGGFGYGTMEHGLMVVRIEDKEIVE
jgi:hypothetical protein